VIAIVGRPNAGKSTLFNRLVREARAIVDRTPGVTRDRNIAPAEWDERRFLLVDTGGFEDQGGSALAESVRAQGALAADEADAIIALFDGRAGLSPADREFVGRLRRLRKPTVYAISKLDTPAHDAAAAEFFAMGVDEVFPISAAHGRGIGELMDRLCRQLPAPASGETGGEAALRLAIVGRPNVGKSSLLNRLVGYERAIVDSRPGTTRDALDTPLRRGRRSYVLVDTAGMRRRPRVQEQLERASVVRALRALERAEIALLVVDAIEGMTDQDARIGGDAWERGRGLVLVVNKCDAVGAASDVRHTFVDELRRCYATLGDVPAVFLSARTGEGVDDIFPAVHQVVGAHRREMRTPRLNAVLHDAVAAHAPPILRRKQVRFFYATQTGKAPPTISVFCSSPAAVTAGYRRYLSNRFRESFSLYGTPVRLRFRSRH
jgi:GTP-binding protein